MKVNKLNKHDYAICIFIVLLIHITLFLLVTPREGVGTRSLTSLTSQPFLKLRYIIKLSLVWPLLL